MKIDAGYKPYNHFIIERILNKIVRGSYRYMTFYISDQRYIDEMIERGYIKSHNVHIKNDEIRGYFGVLISGKDYRDMWGSFDKL